MSLSSLPFHSLLSSSTAHYNEAQLEIPFNEGKGTSLSVENGVEIGSFYPRLALTAAYEKDLISPRPPVHL